MKNIYEVIKQREINIERLEKEIREREIDIERLKKELQALNLAAPMLEDELPVNVNVVPPPAPSAIETQAQPVTATRSARMIWP